MTAVADAAAVGTDDVVGDDVALPIDNAVTAVVAVVAIVVAIF